ncbi:TonB-dependent receptor [Filimonas lacunae]|nr:TonB-dependent receptor [Filimonas lacunae]
MKMLVPNRMNGLFAGMLLLLSASPFDVDAQEAVSAGDTTKKKNVATVQKEEENRNVMLNAANNNGPREVNIGLPSSVGGTTILENDLPVVYYFWPELPTRTWRSSVSLGKTGLMSLKEGAVTTADFGYAVNSYTRLGTDKQEFNANLSTSNFGWIKMDLNAAGKIKNNWYYTAGAFVNYDPISYDPGFTKYSDKTQIFRVGITKRSKNGKGDISLLYKYANAATLPNNYAAFIYKQGGAVQALDNFKIGRSSYYKSDGIIRYKDALSGDFYDLNLGDAGQIANISHTVDLLGHYQLRNNWKLKFTARFHSAQATALLAIPTGITQVTAADGFTYKDDGTPYSGYVQTVLGSHTPKVPVYALQSRVEIGKKIQQHDWRIGLTESYYHVNKFYANRSFYFQEVGANPRQLLASTTDQYGFYNYNIGAEYHNGFENKLTAYFSDEWVVSPQFTVTYGVNLRYHKMKGDFYEQPRTAGFVFTGKEKSYFDNDWMHLGGTINMVYKVTKNFGFLGDFIYTEKNGDMENYSGAYRPDFTKTKTPYASLGIYYNHPFISIVSAVTYLTRNNYQTRLNLVNPEDATQTSVASAHYDIKTTGWTTDIVAKPFKGFNLHYLVTFQNPIYKNYNFTAFNKQYAYDNNNVVEISKVLMEIDPSYTYKKWRIWASGRYFSKQFANLTNQLYFKGWWETFAGTTYQLNSKVGLGLTVVNLLSQNGAKGTITGAELITDPSSYYNNVRTSSYIRPFSVEASFNFKF